MTAFRLTLLSGCAIALLPVATTRTLVATAASILFESTPFILAGLIASVAGIRSARWRTYFGCGCGEGPSGRSLPAFAATWLVIGPAVAAARFLAAVVAARLLKVDRPCPGRPAFRWPLAQLAGLLPMAFAAALVVRFGSGYAERIAHFGPAAGILAGALFGFALAPCGLGAVGLAASLRASAPYASLGFLCLAGIADARSVLRPRFAHGAGEHDALAYAACACACAIGAARHGGALVHPHFTPALWICAGGFAMMAIWQRRANAPHLRWAPALMLAAALVTAPVPRYVATETTLADSFPGERVAFTGMLVRSAGTICVVRYAITCCRADAAPVTLRLTRDLPASLRGWVAVNGTLVRSGAGLRLRPAAFHAVRQPGDPFIYR